MYVQQGKAIYVVGVPDSQTTPFELPDILRASMGNGFDIHIELNRAYSSPFGQATLNEPYLNLGK